MTFTSRVFWMRCLCDTYTGISRSTLGSTQEEQDVYTYNTTKTTLHIFHQKCDAGVHGTQQLAYSAYCLLPFELYFILFFWCNNKICCNPSWIMSCWFIEKCCVHVGCLPEKKVCVKLMKDKDFRHVARLRWTLDPILAGKLRKTISQRQKKEH